VALVANRSKHMALFGGVSDVREWMAAAYKPELTSSHSHWEVACKACCTV
jgi:hypothetical protein